MKLNSMLFGAAAILAAVSSMSATPLPASVVGTDKAIVISSEDLSVLTGGGFAGSIDGLATHFWCVDYENFILPPDAFSANVVALGNWTSTEKNEVQKGNNTNWSLGSPSLTALQRYQVAAYLLDQMSTFQTLTPQSGAALTADQNLQLSIWKVLNQGAPTINSPMPSNLAPLNAAISFVQANPTYGFGSWAVVSGISSGGVLTGSRRQTFLVDLNPVPEPASYALMGLGLGALAFFRRKKS